MPSPSVRSLRTHQRQLLGVARAIAAGASGVRDVLAAVTPGGGKSLLPVLMAQVLMQAGVVERATASACARRRTCPIRAAGWRAM
jgi:hypothetical protein